MSRICTHYGQSNEVKHLRIDHQNRHNLASKLVEGVSAEKLLDNTRNRIRTDLKRSDLLTQDLVNNNLCRAPHTDLSLTLDMKDQRRDDAATLQFSRDITSRKNCQVSDTFGPGLFLTNVKDCITSLIPHNYFHVSPQVMYFAKCLPSREIEEIIKPTTTFCNCKDSCSVATNCNCIKQSGTNYCYVDVKNLESYRLVPQNVSRPTYECNDQCQCRSIICGNKLVQCGPRTGLKVKRCDDERKGEGVFAKTPICSGSFICEYAGEIISEKEASIRFKMNEENKRMNYIFCIDEHFGENSLKTFIDPTVYGNIGRYVNHSCDPNCTMTITRIHDNIPVLALYACKDIEKGEELNYDYGPTDLTGDIGELALNRTKCLCGSTNCRLFLPFDTRIM